jgi:DNA polymerase-3 subunit delta'
MLIGHKKQWEFLKNKSELNQLSHAYLFTGADSIGKKMFAVEFAELVGCKFPDLLIVKSIDSESSIKNKKDSLEIDISQIREVQKFLSYKPYNGGFKIVIIDDAERMNIDAQDCFLKDLEEPKGKTLIILVSSKPDILLQTIASRCQTIKFLKPKDLPQNTEKLGKEQEILNNLLPVIGSDFSQKFKYVKSIDFEKQNVGDIVEVMQKYFRKLLLEKVENEKNSEIKYSVHKLKNILTLIDNINNKLMFTNANPKLALEILLMEI